MDEGRTFELRWQQAMRKQRSSLVVLSLPLILLAFVPGPAPKAASAVPAPVRISLIERVPAPRGGGTPAAAPVPKHILRARAAKAPTPVVVVSEPEAAVEAPVEDGDDQGSSVASGDGGAATGTGSGDGVGSGSGAGVDLTRVPQPLAKDWECGWPWFSDTDRATVVVRVAVNEKGHADAVRVVSSTHKNFEKLAEKCALQAQYRPGVGRRGEPTKMLTRALPIYFARFVVRDH